MSGTTKVIEIDEQRLLYWDFDHDDEGNKVYIAKSRVYAEGFMYRIKPVLIKDQRCYILDNDPELMPDYAVETFPNVVSAKTACNKIEEEHRKIALKDPTNFLKDYFGIVRRKETLLTEELLAMLEIAVEDMSLRPECSGSLLRMSQVPQKFLEKRSGNGR